MHIHPLTIACLLAGFLALQVHAQEADSIVSESRDAASAYMGTINFIVGRLGSECLAPLGRTETAKEFAGAWQQRNARYYTASIKYMGKRLDSAQKSGGNITRDAVLKEYTTAVRGGGEASVNDWFTKGKGTKSDICKRAVTLIESGAMDINPTMPMYGELESLVRWAEEN